MPQKELKIVDLLLVIAKAKKFILRNVFIAGLLAVIISLLIPRWFPPKPPFCRPPETPAPWASPRCWATCR